MKKATRGEGFYAELNTYLAQCFGYCEFFDDGENRRRFEQRHGFCPQKGVTAILVAGRSIKLDRQKVFGLLSRFSKQIRHLTYDDIASYIEFERSRLFAPSENIPGVSIHIVLVLRRYAGNHNYIFYIGTSSARNRISLYVDDKDRLTLRVTDNTGEHGFCRMEAEALKYDQIALVSVELGLARGYTVLTMEVGGVYYADRKLDGISVRLDYISYVMGSDCTGHDGSMMEVAECAVYSSTLRFEDRERLKSYFFEKLHACISGESLEVMVFERNKFMHTRAHTNFVGPEENNGRPGDFVQADPSRRPRVGWVSGK